MSNQLEVKVKRVKPTGVLFVRGVFEDNLAWVRFDCKSKNLKLGEYLNELIGQLRSNTRK